MRILKMLYSDDIRPEIQKVINSMSVENWEYVDELSLKNKYKDVRLSFDREFQCMNLTVEGGRVKLLEGEEEELNYRFGHTMDSFRWLAHHEAVSKLRNWSLEES
jgi:hypothetical protein